MNARERLQAGRAATYEGRFEDALAHFLWFHDHALLEDAAYYGVRLSFALAYWLELAEKYTPAMEAFRARRDAKLAVLQAGELNRSLFHDVQAMSESLNEDEVTATLFAALHERSPEFALACAPIALPMLVRAKRFDFAREYMPEPKARVERLVRELLLNIGEIEDRPRTKAHRFQGFIHMFVQDLRDVLAILKATGASGRAVRMEEQALGALKLKYVRDAVTKRLREV